jgi:hypothetical protein
MSVIAKAKAFIAVLSGAVLSARRPMVGAVARPTSETAPQSTTRTAPLAALVVIAA